MTKTDNDLDEIMAIVHHHCGDEGLAEMLQIATSGLSPDDPDRASLDEETLKLLDRGGWTDRRELEGIADLWAEMGLPAAEIVTEAAEALPTEIACPYPESDQAGWRNWHLNVRPKMPQPFRTQEAAEQHYVNSGYRLDEDGYWYDRSGKVRADVVETEGGYRLDRRLAK